ncbi:MAG: hypothetical protein AAF986_08780 [Pseudomonadota bacterium]
MALPLLEIVTTGASLLEGGELSTAPTVQALLTKRAQADRAVALLLPASDVRARQMEVDVPIGFGNAGTLITHRHVDDALLQLRRAAEGIGGACLYCEPLGFALDGKAGHVDPVGMRAGTLSVSAMTLTTTIQSLVPLEQEIKAVGGVLADSVTPHLAATALFEGDDSGAIVYLTHGETVIAVVDHGQLTVAGTARIGRRHFIGDVMKSFDVTATQARPLVDQFFALGEDEPGEPDELTQKVIRARLEEWAEHCATILKAAPGLSRLVIGTDGGGQIPVAFANALEGLIAPRSGKGKSLTVTCLCGDKTLLHGAAEVLRGAGPVAPQGATFTVARPQNRGQQVLSWLQAHF